MCLIGQFKVNADEAKEGAQKREGGGKRTNALLVREMPQNGMFSN